MPFWEFSVRQVFGWRRKADGLRRIREWDVHIPKKNAKSLIIAGALLGGAAIDGEQRAEIYSCAPTLEQSFRLFETMQLIIEQDDDLASMFDVTDEVIYHRESKSVIRYLSGIPKGKSGKNTHMASIDENQEMPSPVIQNRMKTSMISRSQPLFIRMQTCGDEMKTAEGQYSQGYKLYQRAKKALTRGKTSPSYFPMVFEAEPEAEAGDPEVWAAANPGYGISVNKETMSQLYEDMKDDPAELREFKQYHLNIWPNEAAEYLNLLHWDRCKTDFKYEDLIGRPCFGGLDLGGKSDMSAFSLIFPFVTDQAVLGDEGQTESVEVITWKMLVWYWAHRSSFEAAQKLHKKDSEKFPSWQPWVDKGLLTVTSGNTANYRLIRKQIKNICAPFVVSAIGYDNWHATEMAQNMQDDDKFVMVNVVQGFKTLTEPTLKFKELVQAHEILHNGNDITRYNLKNCRVITDKNENEMLSKKHKAGKIDGIPATLNAFALAIKMPIPRPSAYETHGLRDF